MATAVGARVEKVSVSAYEIPTDAPESDGKIGRASCRERVCLGV